MRGNVPPMQRVLSLDPSGFEVHFWFLVLLGLALGTVVYVLLRRPAARRPRFRTATGVGGGWALLAALLVAAPITWYAWTDSWGHFYSVDVGREALVLGFLYPPRTVRLPRGGGLTVTKRAVVRRSGVLYRLVLGDGGRRELSSQLMRPEEAEAALSRLRPALVRGVDGRSP